MLPDVTIPVSLAVLLEGFRPCFTGPSFRVFRALAVGMLAATGRRTVCGMLVGAGLSTLWPHDRAHRFFARAVWSPENVGLALARLVVDRLVPAGPLHVVVDDTLFHRAGRKVWAAGWFHDGSAKGDRQVGFGNNWVIVGLVVPAPLLGRPVCLPVLARLVRRDTVSASRLWLATRAVEQLAAAFPGRLLHVVADAAYAGDELRTLPASVTWTTRLRKDAALFAPAPPRTGKRGRPRLKGDRLPTLAQLAATATFRPVAVTRYGRTDTVHLAVVRCLWYGVFGPRLVTVILAVTASHDELGKTTTYTYDLAGRRASTTDPLGRKTATTYDRAGRPVTVGEYSPSNTLLRSTSTGYDATGNVVSQTDANGHTTTTTFDARSQQRTITVPVTSSSSITTSIGYDLGGNVTRVTDGRGNPAVTTYNSLGLAESVIEPSTTAYPNLADRTWTTSYNASGQPVTVVAPGGVTRTSTYDELGRLTGESGSGVSTASASRALGYDLVGQLVAADTPGGTQSFTYNDRGLVTASSGPEGTSSFTYDSTGRMTQRVDPAGTSSFTYNARSDLATVTGTVTGGTRTLGYDDAGEITSVAYAGATRTFGYDNLGRTTSDTLTGPGSTVLRSQTYTYDNNDNRLSTTVSGTGVAGAGTQSYAYDWADRLTSWTNQSSVTTTYGWDAAGNRTSKNGVTSTYDARNRLTSDGTASYTYTARGTLNTKTQGSTVTTTVFDAFGRLLADNEGGTVQNYTYDGLDRLATRNSAPFTYAGTEKEPATDYSSSFSRDPDGDLVAVGSTAGNWATLTDTHGDLVAAFTTAGALADSRSFDPFGDPVTTGSTAVHVGFQGSWTDPVTKRVDAQARWYTPGTGTFASRDMANLSISGTAASNRYTYAAANPLAYNDPTGFAGTKSANPSPVSKRATPSTYKSATALSPEAQRQIAAMGADKFWAGVNAALAFQKAAAVKPSPHRPRP